jgi:chromosome partitioning protein
VSGVLSVLVTHTKGGCGKTTIATNLASAFAAGGLRTALADVDRQRSALGWLAARGAEAAPVEALDWRKGAGEVPGGIQRLVIDAPAGLRLGHVDALLREVDIVVLPVLPSIFDERSTARLVARLVELKPVRKGRKGLALVANRVRPRTRASQRLDRFLAGLGPPLAARLADRAIYGELALHGLGIFDVDGAAARPARAEWASLLRTLEGAAG